MHSDHLLLFFFKFLISMFFGDDFKQLYTTIGSNRSCFHDDLSLFVRREYIHYFACQEKMVLKGLKGWLAVRPVQK